MVDNEQIGSGGRQDLLFLGATTSALEVTYHSSQNLAVP